MAFQESFQKSCVQYLAALRERLDNPQATSELSLRAALDALFQNAKAQTNSSVAFVGEGKRIAQGRPDFVLTNNAILVAYVEAGKYGLGLDKLALITSSKMRDRRVVVPGAGLPTVELLLAFAPCRNIKEKKVREAMNKGFVFIAEHEYPLPGRIGAGKRFRLACAFLSVQRRA